MDEPSPEAGGRKRTFSDRQRVLEEKKLQQQKEEAERLRVEEEKRMKREAKRREKRDKERKEAMRVQRVDEQSRNDMSNYYGQNFSSAQSTLAKTGLAKGNSVSISDKTPAKPSTVIMPEYDAFSEGMTPECIMGATDELGELCFFVKWKGTDDADFVPAKKAKIHCPQLVIRYYENIISWK